MGHPPFHRMRKDSQRLRVPAPGLPVLLAALGMVWVSCGERKPAQKSPAKTVKKPDKVDYVIVAGKELSASAERYRAFREKTGHRVRLAYVRDLAPKAVSTVEAAKKIRAFIKKQFAARDPARPFYVLLLGDADKPVPSGTYVEPLRKTTIVTTTTTDNYYADMTGNHVPDLAVGRIPARNDAEVDRVRKKVERYETTYNVGEFNRHIHIIAAPAGFGAFVDTLIESLAYKLLDNWSYKYDVTFTYASAASPVFWVPETFNDKVYELLNAGSLFSVYVGHGNVASLDNVIFAGRSYYILDPRKLDTRLRMANKPPILLMYTCLTGSFDGKESLAEMMIRAEHGPPAVIASTEISHPYPNAVLLKEFGWLAAKHKYPTVGLLFEHAKIMLVKNKGYCRQLIDTYGRLVISEPEIEAQKRTHLHMYTLFGDPAMKMAYIRGRAWIHTPSRKVKRGTTIEVSALTPNVWTGKARFTLESRRKVFLGKIKRFTGLGNKKARDEVIKENHKTANNKVVTTSQVPVGFLRAKTKLSVPKNLEPGIYFVKVYSHDGRQEDAFGHLSITVQ